jgi:drug/metabolite transporter (DMT)-like permease
LALTAAVIGISWSAIFVRWAGVPGVVSALYRVAIAAIVLIPLRAARGGRASRRQTAVACLGGVFFAFDLAFWNSGVMRTQAAVAVALGNNTPIFVGMLTWLVFHRRPSGRFWIGLAIALAGCGLIVAADLGAGARPARGDLLALAGSFFFAGYLVVTERARASMDTLTFSTWAIVGSVATMAVVCVAMGEPLWGFSGQTWAAFIGLGLFTQLAAYFALVYALGHLPATVTSVGLLGQVPGAAILAAIFLGERLSWPQLTGTAVVLAGIIVVTRPSSFVVRPS